MRSLFLFLLLAPGLPAAVSAQAVVQALPGSSDADLLAATMRRVAANPLDLDALVVAGEQSLKVDDLSGAASLFARAEKIDARNGRVKAGMATILVRSERPGEALRYYGQAEAAGLDPRRFAADRGLAFDLIGEQERAQRDYRLALAGGPDDETTRRYALSLGISGRRDEALKALDPLLGRTDRAAWRARAFVLAMTGDQTEAARIASTMMPGGMAQGLLPFFKRLPALPPADRAFAVHFGEVRATPERIADARLAPRLPPLPPAATRPVQVAAIAPPPPVREDRRGRRRRERDGDVTLAARTATLPAAAAVVTATPTARAPVATAPLAPAPVAAPPTTSRDTAATRVAATDRRSRSRPPARFTPGRTQIATATPAATPVSPVAALPPLDVPATVAAVDTPAVSAPAPGLAPLVPATAVASASPATPAAVSVASVAPGFSFAPPATPAPSVTPTPSVTPVPPSTVAASPTPVAPRPAPVRVAEAAPALTAVSPARSVRPVTPALSRGDADAVLARIVASLSIPAAELGVAGPPVRTLPATDAGARTEAAVQAKVARDAVIDQAARQLVAERAPAPTAAERRAAAAKALADRKALAAKKEAAARKLAEDKAAAEERRQARANPSRIWVQVAGGAREGDLPKAWAATRAKAPEIFGSRAGYSARLRATNRVVTGPFKTDAEARAFVNQLAKSGVSSFPFTSDAGESVTRLPAK